MTENEATEAAPAKATKAKGGKKPATKPQRAPRAAREGKAAPKARKADTAATKPAVAKERKARTGTKQETLIALLRSADGVTVEEAAKTFGWEPHTVRGALYGALKKKLGLDVTSEKVEGRGRVYRIGS
jgi:hypothetical protein